MAFKTPDQLANNLYKNHAYDKERVLNFLENYGDHMTDDAYVEFAKSKGFEPKNYDEKGRGYYNEYIKNEDFLKHVSDSLAENGEWDDYQYAGIDADYERSFGSVDTPEKYKAYLQWKKEN